MNKTAIWAIIILMSAAVIGVAAIQLYWINFSIRLDEKKFDERVYSALKNVEERISKHEEENAEWSVINNPNAFNLSSLRNRDGTDFGSLLKGDSIRMDISGYSQYDTWRKKILYYELTSIRQRITVPPLEKRVEPEKVGMMLNQELSSRGIDLKYDYGIYDNESKDFIIINDHYTVQIGENPMASQPGENSMNAGIYNSKYSVDLFPSQEGAPGALKISFPNKRRWLWGSVWPLLLSSVLFTGLILFSFSYVIYVVFRQKKVSEMKTDFINNMTHEFKTPIATISLATDSIVSPKVLKDESKVQRFAGIIKQENKRMLGQVEKVLQMALIDKKDFKLKISEIDVHQVIRQATEHMQLQVKQRGGRINVRLKAEDPVIEGDSTHISNVIHNLLDNAIKYSPESPEIEIRTRNVPHGIQVFVEDEGIGLSKEAKKQIFDKFYRVHTGNLHDVKGFGLGLSYVKAIMTAHKGSVDVESELGKGSTFKLFFPRQQNSD
ncbi:MAG: HAMP domain-containing sensor histidine kinase, partial [Saprospiraceae bacterium]|nr:HAMP domain-containing sensor histidine kinase [Saprospiraceae bacterium]